MEQFVGGNDGNTHVISIRTQYNHMCPGNHLLFSGFAVKRPACNHWFILSRKLILVNTVICRATHSSKSHLKLTFALGSQWFYLQRDLGQHQSTQQLAESQSKHFWRLDAQMRGAIKKSHQMTRPLELLNTHTQKEFVKGTLKRPRTSKRQFIYI